MSFVPSKTPPPPAKTDAPASTKTKSKDDALIAKQDAMLPKGGPDPKFSLPAIEKTKLSNGLNVWLVQQHELPIVSMDLVINAGGVLDTADKSGVASITASMLGQGTKKRSALDISNGLQSIGAQVGSNASWDSSGVSMQTLTKNLDQALDFFADEVANPSFPQTEFAQLQRRTMGAFRQRRSSATAVAGMVYDKVLYGDQAYGHQLTGDEKTVQAIKRDDLVKFYENYYRPNNSTLIVVGDVTMGDVKPRLEKAFSGWQSGGMTPTAISEQKMMAKPGIYLVDMPGAAQSSVSIGQVGIDRTNPDYYAVQVMNSILGGGGTARLFMNLREDKGYTYGARTSFDFRRGAGPFAFSASVQSDVTIEAVIEALNELQAIRGDRPVTATELQTGRAALTRGYPRSFETAEQISRGAAQLALYDLPDDYFSTFVPKVLAVNEAAVTNAAEQYIDPARLVTVIVGDREKIAPGIARLNMGVPAELTSI
jgi:zinc protease